QLAEHADGDRAPAQFLRQVGNDFFHVPHRIPPAAIILCVAQYCKVQYIKNFLLLKKTQRLRKAGSGLSASRRKRRSNARIRAGERPRTGRFFWISPEKAV